MAAVVAVKTGVLQQLTNFNVASVLSHIRRVCTPLDRVGRGSRPRQLHSSCIKRFDSMMAQYFDTVFDV